MLKYPCRLTAVMIGRSRVDQQPSRWPGRGSCRRPSGARVSRQIRQDRASQPHRSKRRGLSCGERASHFDLSRRGLSRGERASLLDPSQWDRASRLDPRATIRREIGARSHFAEISRNLSKYTDPTLFPHLPRRKRAVLVGGVLRRGLPEDLESRT
jgi:hypothetical protein